MMMAQRGTVIVMRIELRHTYIGSAFNACAFVTLLFKLTPKLDVSCNSRYLGESVAVECIVIS